MLRDLGRVREDGTPHTRKGESDPSDSIFVVLLAEEVNNADGNAVRSWNIGSVWLTVGEAQGAANRYVTEGHKSHHGWQFAIVMEYQTGQLTPKAERHGEEFYPPKPAEAQTEADELAALELKVAQLRAKRGQQQTVGASAT